MYTQLYRPQPIGPVKVATPGTPVSVLSALIANGLCVAGDRVAVNKIDLQGLPVNTGNVYIGFAGMNKSTLFNVLAVLAPGQDWNVTNNVGKNTYAFETMYVDADTAGDGVYGSVDEN